MIDRERLIKLLEMTRSSHDGEILNAAKLAARHIEEARSSYAEVLNGGGAAHADYERAIEGLKVQLLNYQKRAVSAESRLRQLMAAQVSAAKEPKPSSPDLGAAQEAAVRRIARELLAKRWAVLPKWEREFLDSISQRRAPLSDKQRAVFKRICEQYL